MNGRPHIRVQSLVDALAMLVLVPLTLLWTGGHPGRALGFGIVATLVTLAMLALSGAYSRASWTRSTPPLAPLMQAVTRAAALILAIQFIGSDLIERGPLLWTMGAVITALIGVRAIRWAAVTVLQQQGRLRERVLLVGGEGASADLIDWFFAHQQAFVVVGVLSEFRARGTTVRTLPVLGDPGALEAIVTAHGVTRVVVFPAAVSWETEQAAIDLAAHRDDIAVYAAAGYTELLATELTSPGPGMPVLMQMRAAHIDQLSAVSKRAMDLAVASALLPFLALELTVLTIASLFDRGWPLLRTEPMLGRGGRPFSMYLLARPARSGWRGHLGDGRGGKLPAILNVLRGDMSMVGPRPIPVAAADLTRTRFARIHTALPGITGPWKFLLSEQGDTENLLHDLYYVRARTFWLDVWLILRSALRFMTRRTPVPAHYGQQAPRMPRARSVPQEMR